jgi:hypothetical protein
MRPSQKKRSTGELLSVQKFPEQLNRAGPVSCIVIIRVRVNLQFPPHELPEQLCPILQIL